MKKMLKSITVIIILSGVISCASKTDSLRDNFNNPPNEYRPVPFWHLNGHLTKERVEKQITEAKNLSGFGGVTVLPVSPGPQHPTGLPCPGMTPEYLSEEYFDRYEDILSISKKLGTEVILYDDIDFPSGSAGGRLQKEAPQFTRKFLVKDEFIVQGNRHISKHHPSGSTSLLMAVSAMNTETLRVVDLHPYMKDGTLEWDVPAGEWRIMFFRCEYSMGGPHGHLVDYMQPEAVDRVMKMTYDQYDKRFHEFFGNVINKTFFDDVGFVFMEETWTPSITGIFKEKFGRNPALYYPALYYDIGPETGAARVAFYDIRSELMAEGYVKQVSEWSARHNMSSMGHPPENYSPNSVVANGDILKYYRHVQIPLLDAIFFYGRGLNGFKQISSAADLGDKPLVGAELCGAFPSDMDSLTLYRVLMEAMARGVNFVVPHGMWYNSDPSTVRIPPLISHENPLLGNCLPQYSQYTARSCMMLQGGNRISDIALLWPIHSIQAESYINRDAQSGLPVAQWVPDNVNHYELSGMLTNELRRDFTYVHPEDLYSGKLTTDGAELVLNNATNVQRYKVLIMPGGEFISLATLQAIKHYYDHGGKVIATSSLPSRSAEFGRDREVQEIISLIFGNEVNKIIPENKVYKSNKNKGQFAFIPHPSGESLNEVLLQMELPGDVQFEESLLPGNGIGYLNYIHKQKEGKDLYFFSNTTENQLSTTINLRGKLKQLELWNPHTGSIEKALGTKQNKQPDGSFTTSLDIDLPAVSSIFVVGIRK